MRFLELFDKRNFMHFYKQTNLLGLFALYAYLGAVNNKGILVIAPKGAGKSTLIKNFGIEGFDYINFDSGYASAKLDAIIHFIPKKLMPEFQKLYKEYKEFTDDEIKAKKKALSEFSRQGKLISEKTLIKIHEFNAVGDMFESLIDFIDNGLFHLYADGYYFRVRSKHPAFILGVQEFYVSKLTGTYYDFYAADRMFPAFILNILRGITKHASKVKPFVLKHIEDVNKLQLSRDQKKQVMKLSKTFTEYSIERRYPLTMNLLATLNAFIDNIDYSMFLLEQLLQFSAIYYKAIKYEGISGTTKVINTKFLEMLGYINYPVVSLIALGIYRMNKSANEIMHSLHTNSPLREELVTLKKTEYFDINPVFRGKTVIDYVIETTDKLDTLLAMGLADISYLDEGIDNYVVFLETYGVKQEIIDAIEGKIKKKADKYEALKEELDLP